MAAITVTDAALHVYTHIIGLHVQARNQCKFGGIHAKAYECRGRYMRGHASSHGMCSHGMCAKGMQLAHIAIWLEQRHRASQVLHKNEIKRDL